MARYRTEFASHLTPTEAFAYLSDFANSQEWDPGVSEATRIGDGPIGIGSRFSVHASFMGRIMALEYTITAFEIGTRLVFEAPLPLGRSVDEIAFVATPSGCNITYNAELQMRGLAKLLDPIMYVAFRPVGNAARGGLVRVMG